MRCRDSAKEWQRMDRSEHSIPTRGLPLRNASCHRRYYPGNSVLGHQMDSLPKQPEALSSLRFELESSSPERRLPHRPKLRWLRKDCLVYPHNSPTNTAQSDTRAQIPGAGNLFQPGDSTRQTAMHNSKSLCRTPHMLLRFAPGTAAQVQDNNMRRPRRGSDFASLAAQWRT